MPRTVPKKPSVRFLQKEAKTLLKAHKAADPSCYSTLRCHLRFSRAADEEILKAEISLQEVQHALALDYGFRSWKDLKAHAESFASENKAVEDPKEIISEMMKRASKERASDIHIEPMAKQVKVRYRVDGILQEMEPMSQAVGQEVIDHVMQMCKMDTAQKDKPQDGRILANVEGRSMDFRVNMTPGIHGEVVAMRVLEHSLANLSLDNIEMEEDQLALYRQQIQKPGGLVLFTGPTGCGKTTSLYASLQDLNDTERKIMTIEDPVELALEGIDQIPLRPASGLGFEQALWSVMRQAPDVIMVGEIGDLATAKMLVQAALMGHLVFSMLHTNDCSSAFARLLDIGLEAPHVADAVSCVVAQRLIRRVCDDCKKPYEPRPAESASLQLDKVDQSGPIYKGEGCDKCRGTGYHGRTGVYSILPMSDAVVEGVLARDVKAIEHAARAEGYTSLREAGIRKLFRGETTPEEVKRLT